MNEEKRFPLSSNSQNYVLFTSEYMGTKDFKFLIRAELRGETKTTLFLMGVPDPINIYARGSSSDEEVKTNLYLAVNNAVASFIENNEWEEGSIYYGEMLGDGNFHMGTEKPSWDDGNWGQKADF